jgi:hypothetical protein
MRAGSAKAVEANVERMTAVEYILMDIMSRNKIEVVIEFERLKLIGDVMMMIVDVMMEIERTMNDLSYIDLLNKVQDS